MRQPTRALRLPELAKRCKAPPAHCRRHAGGGIGAISACVGQEGCLSAEIEYLHIHWLFKHLIPTCKEPYAMLASHSPAAAPLAGQRCLPRHHSTCTGSVRPRHCAAARRPATAAAAAGSGAAAGEQLERTQPASSKRHLLMAAGLLAASPLLSLPAAADEAASSSSGGTRQVGCVCLLAESRGAMKWA